MNHYTVVIRGVGPTSAAPVAGKATVQEIAAGAIGQLTLNGGTITGATIQDGDVHESIPYFQPVGG